MRNVNDYSDTTKRVGRRMTIEILNEGSYFVKPFTHSQMERCLKEGIFDERVMEGFYRMKKYMPDLGSEIYVNYKVVKNNGAASC